MMVMTTLSYRSFFFFLYGFSGLAVVFTFRNVRGEIEEDYDLIPNFFLALAFTKSGYGRWLGDFFFPSFYLLPFHLQAVSTFWRHGPSYFLSTFFPPCATEQSPFEQTRLVQTGGYTYYTLHA